MQPKPLQGAARCPACIRRGDDCVQREHNVTCNMCRKRRVKCALSVGQTQGRKRRIVFDSDEDCGSGPSLRKKACVASPKRGNSKEDLNEWLERIVDALEIANAERHGVRTQLEGVCQGLEAANAERQRMRGQLEGLCNALKYIAGLAYKAYIRSSINVENEQGGRTSRGVQRREGNSKGSSKVQGTDQGVTKGVDRLRLADNGKGKQKEVLEEGTVQEG